MYILLASATQAEILPFSNLLKAKSFSGTELQVTITGVGLVPTAHAIMHQICRRRPDLVIQAGIAGAFLPGMTGKAVCVKEDSFGDLGVSEDGKFRTLFDLRLAEQNVFPFSEGQLVNPHFNLLSLFQAPAVRAVTVHTITTDKESIARYQQKEKVVVESMEGAALHYICLMEHVPFVQVRTVSNEVGERDKSRWKMKEAVLQLTDTLTSFIHQLENSHAD